MLTGLKNCIVALLNSVLSVSGVVQTKMQLSLPY